MIKRRINSEINEPITMHAITPLDKVMLTLSQQIFSSNCVLQHPKLHLLKQN